MSPTELESAVQGIEVRLARFENSTHPTTAIMADLKTLRDAVDALTNRITKLEMRDADEAELEEKLRELA